LLRRTTTSRTEYIQSVNGDGSSCNLAKDDDGSTYLWAVQDATNASSSLQCVPAQASSQDPFAYDAVYAVARALHDIIEVRNGSAFGIEVYTALLEVRQLFLLPAFLRACLPACLPSCVSAIGLELTFGFSDAKLGSLPY
jgi:hypothetical protein